MKQKVFLAIGVCCLLGAVYGLWLIGKWFNYKLAYESGVQSTIKEMVKPECLIQPAGKD